MTQLNRRNFLKGAAATAAFPLVTVSGTKSSGRVLGANDTINIAVAGIHGRGHNHIDEYLGTKGVRITYLVDPDSTLFDGRAKPIREKTGDVTAVQDIRKALDDKNLDVVSIATPNHWHSLMTIWA